MPHLETTPVTGEDDTIRHMWPNDPRLLPSNDRDSKRNSSSHSQVPSERSARDKSADVKENSRVSAPRLEHALTAPQPQTLESRDHSNQAPSMKHSKSESDTKHHTHSSSRSATPDPGKNKDDDRGRTLERQPTIPFTDSVTNSQSKKQPSSSSVRTRDSSKHLVVRSQPVVQPSQRAKDASSKSKSRELSRSDKGTQSHSSSKSPHKSNRDNDVRAKDANARVSHAHADDDKKKGGTSGDSAPLSNVHLNVPDAGHHSRSQSTDSRTKGAEHKSLKLTKSESHLKDSARREDLSAKAHEQRESHLSNTPWCRGDTLQVPGDDGYHSSASSGYSSSFYASSRDSSVDSRSVSGSSISLELPKRDADASGVRSHSSDSNRSRAHVVSSTKSTVKIGFNDVRPDILTAERMGDALQELLFCKRLFKKWAEKLDEFDLSHSGADKKPALASINKLRESVSQAIDASRSLIHQHERFSHAMANALADTCDSDTGELLRPEELNGLGDKIQRLSALLAQHVMQMQERLVELTGLFEELRKEVQESRRQKILRFLQTLFKVLEVILTAVTIVAPIAAPGIGILVSAGTAGGAALIAAASKLCKEAEKDYENRHAKIINFLSQDVREELGRVSVALQNVQDCQRVLQLDVENKILVMNTEDAGRARESWTQHEKELRKVRKAPLKAVQQQHRR